MKKLGMLGIIGGAAILTAVPLSLQWSHTNVGPSLDSAEAQERPLTATSVAGVSRRVHRRTYRRAAYASAVAGVGPYGYGSSLANCGYLTEQATPHLAASTAAATPRLTSVYKQATPYRTVISADRPTTYGVSGFTTEGARRVGLGHLRRTRRSAENHNPSRR